MRPCSLLGRYWRFGGICFFLILRMGVRPSRSAVLLLNLFYLWWPMKEWLQNAFALNKMVKTEELEEKPFLLPPFPPQFVYELLWERSRASAVGIRRLYVWAMARWQNEAFASFLWRWMPYCLRNGIYLPDHKMSHCRGLLTYIYTCNFLLLRASARIWRKLRNGKF